MFRRRSLYLLTLCSLPSLRKQSIARAATANKNEDDSDSFGASFINVAKNSVKGLDPKYFVDSNSSDPYTQASKVAHVGLILRSFSLARQQFIVYNTFSVIEFLRVFSARKDWLRLCDVYT